MICADGMNKNTCGGDSGGPLLANINGKFTLVGITSWGPEECGGTLDNFGVYVDISETNILSFINKIN